MGEELLDQLNSCPLSQEGFYSMGLDLKYKLVP
jgi:hypothetical protein